MLMDKRGVVKKEKLKTFQTEVKVMVPTYKTVGVGEKERQVLNLEMVVIM